MSAESKGQTRREALLTGMSSIFHLSGDAKGFRDLLSQHVESDWHALSSDVESIGADIRTALYQFISELPPEKKRLLADRIRRALIVSDTPSIGDEPIRRQLMKDLDAVHGSQNFEVGPYRESIN